jgi:hypothetical protein
MCREEGNTQNKQKKRTRRGEEKITIENENVIKHGNSIILIIIFNRF